jgi:hypothetical protein
MSALALKHEAEMANTRLTTGDSDATQTLDSDATQTWDSDATQTFIEGEEVEEESEEEVEEESEEEWGWTRLTPEAQWTVYSHKRI